MFAHNCVVIIGLLGLILFGVGIIAKGDFATFIREVGRILFLAAAFAYLLGHKTC